MYSQIVYTVLNDKYLCHLLQYDTAKKRPQEIVVKEIPKDAILIKSSRGFDDPDDARASIASNIKAFQDFDHNFSQYTERTYYNDMLCKPTSVFYVHPNYKDVHDGDHVGWLIKRSILYSYYSKMRSAIDNNQIINDINAYLDEFKSKVDKQPVVYPKLKDNLERWLKYKEDGFPLTVDGVTELIPITILKYYYIKPKH